MMSHETAGDLSLGVLRQAKWQSRAFLKQFIAERGIEQRSPIRNLIFPQFPRMPLFKVILQILTKLQKTGAE